MSSAAQVLRQADALKASVSDTSSSNSEAWVSRQNLQDLYQKLLVIDLEYALDKKVEQDLWNYAFKNQITALQSQSKDKQNASRSEIQASLNLFLETASGFYLQLLQEICSAFQLDLPFRRKTVYFGALKECYPYQNRIKHPKKTSCMYICQHILVHLGDIARYRQQIEQAQTYYQHAAYLVPSNGQPYNQLAILEAARGNKLSTVFFYIRSIAVKHPFPVAATNLEKFYIKLTKEIVEFKGKLSMSEYLSSFLQFHAMIHLCTDLDRAKRHADKLGSNMSTHISSPSFSSYQLIQMVAINLFAMSHARGTLVTDSKKIESKKIEKLSKDEQRCFELVFSYTVAILTNLLQYTPKQEQKSKDYHTLPAIKVLLDWLRLDKVLLGRPVFKGASIWTNLSKLLNNLQFHSSQKDPFNAEKYASSPLPEDSDLQCFLPIEKAYEHENLCFTQISSDSLPADIEVKLRCHRLIEHGKAFCEECPSLNLLNYQTLKSGRLQFCAPTAHVKLLPDSDSETSGSEKKTSRQNVAIQAIMQNKAGKHSPQNSGDMGQQGNRGQSLSKNEQKSPTGTKQHQKSGSTPSHMSPQGQGQAHFSPSTQDVTQHQRSPEMIGSHPQQAFHGSPHHVQRISPQVPQGQGHFQGYNQGQGQDQIQSGQLIGTFVPGSLEGSQMGQQTSPGQGPVLRGQLPPGVRPQQHGAHQDPRNERVNSQQFRIPSPYNQAPAPQMVPMPSNLTQGQQNQPIGQRFPHQSQQQPRPGQPPIGSQQQMGNIQQFMGSQQIMGMSNQQHMASQQQSGQQQHMTGQQQPISGQQQHMGQQQMMMGNKTQMLNRPPIRNQSPGNIQGPATQYLQPSPEQQINWNKIPSPVQQHQFHQGDQQQPIRSHQMSSPMPQFQPRMPVNALQQLIEASKNQGGNFRNLSPLHIPPNPLQMNQSGSPMRGGQVNITSPSVLHTPADFHEEEPELKFSDLRGLNIKPPTPGTATLFQPMQPNQGTFPQKDTQMSPGSSLFASLANPSVPSVGQGEPPSTYSLFSQSPWAVQIRQTGESRSQGASPFSSEGNSLRNTPDPLSQSLDTGMASSGEGLANINLGYAFGSVDGNWMGPAPPRKMEESPKANTLLSDSIQSLWSSGPSPLEKLLEQQKHQRQFEPH